MCIDYYAINSEARKDHYPFPQISDLLDRLLQATRIPKIDLVQGYHQVAIIPGHEHETAFTSRFRLLEVVVLPFWLYHVPSIFQRLMNSIFTTNFDSHILNYLSDIFIYSNNNGMREDYLQSALKKLWIVNLFAMFNKLNFGQIEVEYLGHIMGNNYLKYDPKKTLSIIEWPVPT